MSGLSGSSRWTTSNGAVLAFENPNDRIEVQVRGRADAAWQRIIRVVEPCAFRVEGGIEIYPLVEGRPAR